MDEDTRPSSFLLPIIKETLGANLQGAERGWGPFAPLHGHGRALDEGLRGKGKEGLDQGRVLVGLFSFFRVRIMFLMAGASRLTLPMTMIAEGELRNALKVTLKTPRRLHHMRPSHRQKSEEAEKEACGFRELHQAPKERVDGEGVKGGVGLSASWMQIPALQESALWANELDGLGADRAESQRHFGEALRPRTSCDGGE